MILGHGVPNVNAAPVLPIENPSIPYEVKFADVTFQLNDVTRYLIQTELNNVLSNRQHFQNQLEKFTLFFARH